MLNHLKRIAKSLDRNTIQGRIVETSQNGPCQAVYLKNGFSFDGSIWAYTGGSTIPDPAWLAVKATDSSRIA
jgi:hypothetical protein